MSDNTLLNLGTGGDSIRDIDRSGVKTQVVVLDVGGSGAESLVTLTNPHPIQPAATSFVFSASGQNTTTTQLAAAATFTGTIESTSSQQCISILLTCDQPGTLTINQFIDASGTFRTNTFTFYILAGVPFSENLTANGNYAQVVFNNTGASTTTTLNLNTAYGTLPPVDNVGNLPVSLPMQATRYSTTGVIAINTILTTVDCVNAAGVIIQCSAMGTTGVVTPQWSNDGVTYIAQSVLTTAGVTAATITAAGVWVSPVYGRYLQLKLTTATTAATTTFAVQAMSMYYGVVQSQAVAATVTGDTAAAASADALANPTIKQIGADNMVFNGTTWDRQRGMSGSLTTGDTGAKTATGNGATQTNVGNKGAQILVNMGTVSGTTPTCVLKVQGSVDGGTTWYDIPGATTASLIATGVFGITVYPGIAVTAGGVTTGTTAGASGVLPRSWRMVWTIGGTTPSFTITNIQVNYIPN